MKTETATDAAVEAWVAMDTAVEAWLRQHALYRAAGGVMERARSWTISANEIAYVEGAFGCGGAHGSREHRAFRGALEEGVRARFG